MADDLSHLLNGEPRRTGRTFREAAESYLKHGGSSRYLQAVLDYFGDRPVASIVPFDVTEMSKAL